jgi:hypothetical protein
MIMKIWYAFLFISIWFPLRTLAQAVNPGSPNPSKADTASKWTFYAEADYYIFPKDQDILMFIGKADHDWLHLQVRYNYEDLHTGSVFGGLNFAFGNQLEFLLKPMAGLVFGRTNGVAPGLEADLRYKIFYFSSQSEYLFDFSGQQNDFAYTYLQLGASLLKHFELGMAAQRTRVFQNSLDLQRGAFIGYGWHGLKANFTWFNPFSESYFFICTLSVDF